MATEHDRFDELAVGHVLGGLPSSAAAEFRSHLTGCRDCRARVAELRDIASDLAAAERDERSHERVKTEVARRNAADPLHGRAWEVSVRVLAGTLVVAVLGVLGLAFWNFHLRDQNAELLRVARTREAVLDGLATGDRVPTELSAGVSGRVVTDADDVTIDLVGLPALGADEQLVVWLLGDVPTDHYWVRFAPDRIADGRLAFRDPHRGAGTLVVSVEGAEPGNAPSGRQLVRAELSAAG
jgi:hypothetical protein